MSNIAVIKKETIDIVEARISELQNTGGLHFPPNYSPQNALKSAWLIIQETQDKDHRPALEVCTRESVANALLDMVIQGLSPSKKQVYFIVRGKKLCADRSYFGTMAATKRLECVEEIFSQVVYEGDEFEFVIERSTKRITKHIQKLENIDISKLKAAYCTIIHDGGKEYSDVMTIAQIRKSWERGATKGQSSAHKDQPDQMAMRTVINRTCKAFFNTSDDSDLLIEAFNNTAGGDYDKEEEVATVIMENANGEVIDIVEPVVTKAESKKQQPVKEKETPKVQEQPPEQLFQEDGGPGF